jgi:O-methyltransferase
LALRNFLNRYVGPLHERRRAWSKHLARVAQRHRLLIYPHHLTWSLPGRLTELEAQRGDLPGLPLDCCQLLYSVANSVAARGVEGDTAECGVRYGKSSFFILNALNDPTRPHHLCDSFEGLSEPTDDDAEIGGRRDAWQAGDLEADERIAREQLKAFPQCRFHRGWIPDCFAGLEDRRFAMVHIDVDLYEPTLAAFEFFHPRLTPGAVMVCDDYGFASCPGARKAVDEYFAGRPDVPIELPSGQALIFHKG